MMYNLSKDYVDMTLIISKINFNLNIILKKKIWKFNLLILFLILLVICNLILNRYKIIIMLKYHIYAKVLVGLICLSSMFVINHHMLRIILLYLVEFTPDRPILHMFLKGSSTLYSKRTLSPIDYFLLSTFISFL